MNPVSPPARPGYTAKQGQYLAFIHAYRRLHGRAPAEADIQRFFRVSPPSVHQMILKLEQAGLITRQPGVARSIALTIDPKALPELDPRHDQPVKITVPRYRRGGGAGARAAAGVTLQRLPGRPGARVSLTTEVVRYRRERWATPSGETVLVPLPAGIVGGFGPGLRRFLLVAHAQGQVTTERLVALLAGIGIEIPSARWCGC